MHDGVLVMCAVTNDLLDMELLRSGKLLVKRAATVVRAAVGACVEQVRALNAGRAVAAMRNPRAYLIFIRAAVLRPRPAQVRPASAVPLSVLVASGVPSKVGFALERTTVFVFVFSFESRGASASTRSRAS